MLRGLRLNVLPLRGMFEHSEEYFFGKGRYPDQWFIQDSLVEGVKIDASSTFINETGH